MCNKIDSQSFRNFLPFSSGRPIALTRTGIIGTLFLCLISIFIGCDSGDNNDETISTPIFNSENSTPYKWRVISKKTDDVESKRFAVSKFIYDEQNRVKKVEHTGTGTENKPRTDVYQYDSGGVLTGIQTVYGIEGVIPESVNFYNDKGNIIRKQWDESGDGIMDFTTSYYYEYNENGKLTKYIEDDYSDNIYDNVVIFEYDEDNHLIHEENDTDDGSVHLEVSYKYNEKGEIIEKQEDRDANGIIDRVTTYQYEETGKISEEKFDNNLDGEFDQISLNVFDSKGNLVRIEFRRPDGTPLRITRYSYNDSGQLLKTEEDLNADGVVDSYVIYENVFNENGRLVKSSILTGSLNNPNEELTAFYFDASGNQIKREFDENNDGNPEIINYYEYDSYNHLKAVSKTQYGKPIKNEMFTYDASGKKLMSTVQYVDDPTSRLKTPETKFFHYDPNGFLIKEETDLESDEKIDRTDYYTVDENGIVTHKKTDTNRDGTPDTETQYIYDKDGKKVIQEKVLNISNMSVLKLTTTYYDKYGNKSIEEVDIDGNGSIDQIVNYTWDIYQ